MIHFHDNAATHLPVKTARIEPKISISNSTFCYSDAAQEGAINTRLMLRRRTFLKGLAAGAGLVLGGTSLADTAPAAATGAGDPSREYAVDPLWTVLASVQAHLFPSEAGAPGAAEINAAAYLQNALHAPDGDPEEKKFLLAGADWLRKMVAHDHSGGQFGELTEAEREAVLRRMESSAAGKNWLALLLYYLLEALLTDPVYGGNPNAVGWTWLGYTPGFPRPPANKRYFKLLDR